MIYIDACLVIAAITREEKTQAAQSWLRAQPNGTVFYSLWVRTEIASALSIKMRTGALSGDQRAESELAWRIVMPGLKLCDILPEHFETAARYCEQHDLGLRAGDALHLAIARGHDLRLATIDGVLAEAAARLGIGVVGV